MEFDTNWQQKDLFERKNMKSQTGFNMDENQKRAAVEKYIELRKTMTTRDARTALGGISPDSIYKWSERFGLADQVKTGQNKGQSRRKTTAPRQKRSYRFKPTPQLISIPVDTSEPLVGHHQPRQETTTKKPLGNIVVIMGDPESVKAALQTAFNVVTHK